MVVGSIPTTPTIFIMKIAVFGYGSLVNLASLEATLDRSVGEYIMTGELVGKDGNVVTKELKIIAK